MEDTGIPQDPKFYPDFKVLTKNLRMTLTAMFFYWNAHRIKDRYEMDAFDASLCYKQTKFSHLPTLNTVYLSLNTTSSTFIPLSVPLSFPPQPLLAPIYCNTFWQKPTFSFGDNEFSTWYSSGTFPSPRGFPVPHMLKILSALTATRKPREISLWSTRYSSLSVTWLRMTYWGRT